MFGVKCWVPLCNASKDLEPNRIFFPLPRDYKYKETWLALTGKKLISEEQVYFCDSHFRRSDIEMVMDKVIGLTGRALPYHRMPQMICRTCMTTISSRSLFCVVSGTIPSPVPPEYKTDLVQCRPEPLYQILTFCIPNLNLEQNPPAIVCIKCYHYIWQYFVFKLTCNSLDYRIRGNLSVEQYGKLVLCRACPTTSGTRFFILNESEPMGQIFKSVFLNNYPTTIVPLKLCLKCWNLLVKLTQFHQQCQALDQIIQRCTEASQAYNNIPPPPKGNVSQSLQNLIESCPSTSTSSRDLNSGSFNKLADIKKDVKIKSMEMKSQNGIEKQSSVEENERDSEMPRLLPQVGTELNTKSKMSTGTRKNFTPEFRLFLAKCMQKYSNILKPDLDPIENAKADLEMWVKVMIEIHSFGYTNTLASVQALWNRMKSETRLAQKSAGPMTYLDYLVNLSTRNDASDSSSSIGSDDTESCDSDLTEKIYIQPESTKTVTKETVVNNNDKDEITLENLLKRPFKVISVPADSDVICIEDSDMEEIYRKNPDKNIDSAASTATVSNNCDINRKENKDIGKIEKNLDASRKIRIKRLEDISKSTDADSFKASKKRKGKLRQKRIREAWNKEQKLELVREMRRECNSLIEKEELDSFKLAPWKNILERLASRGFKGCNFAKFYSEWAKMKVSATIYEKNGQDIVDDEVWDLLQVHKDVQKSLLKKRRSGEDVLQDDRESKKSEISKKPKLISLDSKNPITSDEITVKDSTISTTQNTAGSEQTDIVTLTKPTTSLSQEEKLKILDLIELQLVDRMSQNGGVINESFSSILEEVKYKNYSVGVLTSIWQKLAMTASECKKTPSPIHQKVLKVLSIYRQNKVGRKVNVFREAENAKQGITTKENVSSCSSKRRGRPSKYRDNERLDLISVIRSFGNEVFKKKSRFKSREFWNQVTVKFHAMGYSRKMTDISIMWSSMLRSAKLSWAQEDRKPFVGDKEIIDFMMEVIQNKEQSKQDSQLDFNEDSTVQDDLNNCEENLDSAEKDSSDYQEKRVGMHDLENYEECLEKKEEPFHEPSNNCVKDEIGSSSEDDSKSTTFNDYDYVSLEDIQKQYGGNVINIPKPTAINEIIEISDSEEG